MLTISKSSKIGRYYNWLMDNFSSKGDYSRWNNLSLCAFCQNIFWRTLFIIGLAGVLLIGAGVVLFILLAPFINEFVTIESVYVAMSLVIWAAFTIIFSAVAVSEYLERRESRREYVELRPSLVIEWLKAKKQKVCPRINVIE